MEIHRLEHLLEDQAKAPFYDLLGGLSDNLLTIGAYAGSFLTCDACGVTFSLKDQSWKCYRCGQGFEVKFKPAARAGAPFEARAVVSGLTKPRCNPHWYYEDENWTVAEFLTQILRLTPETFLGPWFHRLGAGLDAPTTLETVLCWPRFRFGNKTIQPDFAVGFERDIVLMEFKRPKGGVTPPVEVLGQICFASEAARRLKRSWRLVLVPGRDSSVRKTAADYCQEALANVAAAQDKWALSPDVVGQVRSTPADQLASRVVVLGWEQLIRITSQAVRDRLPDSWTRTQALTKLAYFQASRSGSLGLLAPAVR